MTRSKSFAKQAQIEDTRKEKKVLIAKRSLSGRRNLPVISMK